jgi:CRISPR-associated protein Cst2
MTTLRSLSIAARVMIDMHALNNEGSESNRLMTRQVGIVIPAVNTGGENGYVRSTVNAISGDMNKHIFADYLRHIALDSGLPLCQACIDLDPGRMMANPGFEDWVKGTKEGPSIVDRLLSCTLDDIGGILITAGGNSVKRKSAVEFGWTVGLPEVTEVQEFIHARHSVRRITRAKAERGASEEERQQALAEKEANLGQMVFNRPASSGVYAFVAHLDAAAIGFNDIRGDYPDMVPDWQDEETAAIDRAGRLQAALLALAQTVIQPKGALTSTQLPHVLEIEGFVSVSTSAAAAPLISPLVDDYTQRAEQVAGLLNQMHGESVGVLPFSGQDGLLEQIGAVIGNYGPGRYGGR